MVAGCRGKFLNCRKLFIAPKGKKIVKIDYAQIEPRLLAHYANDEELIKCFEDGLDFYSLVIKDVLGLEEDIQTIYRDMKPYRACGKTLGLGIGYGAQGPKVRKILNKELGLQLGSEDGDRAVFRWWKARWSLNNLKRDLTHQVARNGHIVTVMGRKIYIPKGLAELKKKEGKQLNMLNTIAQVSAGDLLNYSMGAVEEVIDTERASVIMQVHDESVWEVEEDYVEEFIELSEPVMTSQIVEDYCLRVPLKIEASVGQTWGG